MHSGIPAQPVGAGTAVGASQSATPNPKLVRAAHEFEAQMMKELLKPMAGGDPLTGNDDGSDPELGSGSGSGGALADFASEALGQALSQRGGFGIADRIVKDLTRVNSRHSMGNGAGTVTEKVTATQHGDTVMRTLK
jgi:Rod binding domain-containing protein